MILAAPSWSGDQLSGNWDVLRYYTLDHLRITFLALGIGFVVAFPLGLLGLPVAARPIPPCWRSPTSLYSIPSLALLGLLSAIFGEILSDKPLIFTAGHLHPGHHRAERRRRAAAPCPPT